MRTMLLFPPTWHPSQPYLSLPSLTGFLKQEGVTDVIQRDLRIEVLDSYLNQATGLETDERMQEKVRTLERLGMQGETGPSSQEHLARMKEALDWFPPLYDHVEEAKWTLRSEQFYDQDKYRESLFLIDRWLAFLSTLYFPTRISVVDNQWRYSIYSSKDILKAVADEQENPYLEVFRSRLVPDILAQAPDLVGVSITATSQIMPGLTLCRLIKQANPDLHLTIGGSIFTRLVDDVKGLMERYQTPFFFFTDECFALSPTKRLCRQLIEAGVNAQWTCEMRFEKNLTRDLLKLMRDAGCLKIVFGLESYNQRVMDFMKKGIRREHVNRIIDDCLDLDIAVHCYVLIGFPTETEAEAMETANFIRGHTRLHSSYGFSCQPCLFDLEKEAPIMSDPASYGIRRIMRPASEDLSLGYFYEVMEGMKPDEAERVYQYVYEKISEVVCELPFNYAMADGLLYIARAKTPPVATG